MLGKCYAVRIAAQPCKSVAPVKRLHLERLCWIPVFRRDRFLLRQKHLAISEKYYVNDEEGNPIMFVQRPARLARNLLAIFGALFAAGLWVILMVVLAGAVSSMLSEEARRSAEGAFALLGLLGLFPVMIATLATLSPKRHVTFYRDESKAEKLLEVLQDKKFYFLTATYTVCDAAGQVLARLRKNYLHNIFRKRWSCEDHHGREICVAKEDSILLSLLRRVLGPFFGLLRANFVLLRAEQMIGEFNRKFTILDRYVLDLSADPQHTFDRRIAIALGVMLDTGERR